MIVADMWWVNEKERGMYLEILEEGEKVVEL